MISSVRALSTPSKLILPSLQACVDGWMYVWMYVWMDEQMDGQVDGCETRWIVINGWMDEWM